MAQSNIEWTEESWNPIVGCSIVSPGCTNCYAMKMAHRIEGINAEARAKGTKHASQYDGTTKVVNGNAVWTGKVQLAEHILLNPLKRKKPTTYFVNSMGDLFHESVPDEWIDKVFAVMALSPQHTFQVLTKRAKRMRDYFAPAGCVNCGDGQLDGKCCEDPYVLHGDRESEAFRDALIEGAAQSLYASLHPGEDPSLWLSVHMPLPNVWLGVSTERQAEANERIPMLLQTPAAIRFISAEPLLAQLDLTAIRYRDEDCDIRLNAVTAEAWVENSDSASAYTDVNDGNTKLDWVIVGGESGPDARPMRPDWARSLKVQCEAAGVPFFFKQWGSHAPMGGGSDKMVASSKKNAGRALDGIEYNEMPVLS